jgi:hypothetical protein
LKRGNGFLIKPREFHDRLDFHLGLALRHADRDQEIEALV